MIQFIDGPAAGQTLALQRAPLFLRVVRGPTGAIDALDQLEDRPSADEDVVAYMRIGESSRVHVAASVNGRRRCQWYAMAEYRVVAEQPDDEKMRNQELWRAWAREALAAYVNAPSTQTGFTHAER